jgi:hypothetical protein
MSEQKIIIDTFGSDDPPAAATFDVGATTPEQIEEAVTSTREQALQIAPDDLARRDV